MKRKSKKPLVYNFGGFIKKNMPSVGQAAGNANSFTQMGDNVVGMIPGYGQFHALARSGTKAIQSGLGDSDNANVAKAWLTPQHELVTQNLDNGKVGKAAIASMPIIGQINEGLNPSIKDGEAYNFNTGMMEYSKVSDFKKHGGPINPNARVEEGEYVITNSNPVVTKGKSMSKISGKDLFNNIINKVNGGTHNSGNDTAIMANGGFVISNHLMYDNNNTYADYLSPIMNRVAKLNKIQEKSGFLSPEQKTSLGRYNSEIERVVQMNAQHNNSVSREKIMKNGGMIKQYEDGTIIPPYKSPNMMNVTQDVIKPTNQVQFNYPQVGDIANNDITGTTSIPNNFVTNNSPTDDYYTSNPAPSGSRSVSTNGFERMEPMPSRPIQPVPTAPIVEPPMTKAPTKDMISPNVFDYKDKKNFGAGLDNLGMGLMSNFGNIRDMFEPYNAPNEYGQVKPKYLTSQAARSDLRRMYNTSLSKLRESGRYNSAAHGAMLSQYLSENRKLNENYDNTNAGIFNQNVWKNKELEVRQMNDNAADIARTQDIRRNARNTLGQNIMTQRRDVRNDDIKKELYDQVVTNSKKEYTASSNNTSALDSLYNSPQNSFIPKQLPYKGFNYKK